MARRRRSYRRHYTRSAGVSRHKKFTLPIAPIAGIAYALTPPLLNIVNGQFEAGVDSMLWRFTGFSRTTGKFELAGLMQGFLPIAAGMIAHKAAGILGINRMLASSGVPIVRV